MEELERVQSGIAAQGFSLFWLCIMCFQLGAIEGLPQWGSLLGTGIAIALACSIFVYGVRRLTISSQVFLSAKVRKWAALGGLVLGSWWLTVGTVGLVMKIAAQRPYYEYIGYPLLGLVGYVFLQSFGVIPKKAKTTSQMK